MNSIGFDLPDATALSSFSYVAANSSESCRNSAPRCAHLLTASVNASELAFFGGFPLFAVLGSWHQDMRKLASGDDAFRHFHAATPFLPVSKPSRAPPVLREDATPIVIGTGVTFVIPVRNGRHLIGGRTVGALGRV